MWEQFLNDFVAPFGFADFSFCYSVFEVLMFFELFKFMGMNVNGVVRSGGSSVDRDFVEIKFLFIFVQ